MLRAVFTLDYEIHGNGQGCPRQLMVEPTARLLGLFGEFGARLTIMADVAEILRFRQRRDELGRDAFHHDAIADQLRQAVAEGHDVQLHLHSSYFNARIAPQGWSQDWSEYDFASLPRERMGWMVATGKRYLEALLQPVDPSYRCTAFRAANWSVSPSANVIAVLLENGITVDSSVFKHGRRQGLVNFDYAHADSALVPWPVSDDDICRRDAHGRLWEVPIYSEHRSLAAFLSAGRLRRWLAGRGRGLPRSGRPPAAPAGPSPSPLRRAARALAGRHAWKADFNQCSSRQLIGALGRAAGHDVPPHQDLPFVLIGHSKLCSPGNDRALRRVLAHVVGQPRRYGFATLAQVAAGLRSEVTR